MKTKITLFLTFNFLIFVCSGLNAQTVSGISSNTGCQNSGIITSSTTGLGATPQYQLLRAGIAVSPVPGDNTQFTSDPVFTGLSSGTYVVNARATSVGPVFSSSNIIVTDGYTAMAVVTPTKVANCVGGTAALTSTITNGKSPFTYSIATQTSPGVILQNSGSVNSNTFTFNALAANSYIISVTDACGQTITGATSISNPTIGLADIKLGSVAFPMFNTLFDCSSPLAIRNELLFQYVANSTTISASDAANFTWKIKYYGQLYGKDINADGYSDIGGDGYSPLTGTIRMPLIADKDGILADISNMRAVLIDNCGNTKEFPITQYGGNMGAYNCGGTGMIRATSNRLGCYPLELTFTNIANPADVVSKTMTNTVEVISDLTPGATYHVTYIDDEGYTTGNFGGLPANQNIAIPTVASMSIAQNTAVVQQNLNVLGFGRLFISVNPFKPDDVLSYTVITSDNPVVPVGYTGSVLLDSSGYAYIPRVNATDPVGYWPMGNYTITMTTPCGSRTINAVVKGYAASLSGNTLTSVCGGFNYVMNGTFDIASAYQVVIVSGPSSVGQVRDLANTTASLPFNGLSYGTYVFGLRIKGGTQNVLTQTVTYNANNAIIVDKTNTGGFVCAAGAVNGVLTITAQSNSPAPGNILEYALSTDGGVNYSIYQSGNTFSGLTNDTYFFRIKDGCGNVITQSVQIGVAAAPDATANGMASPATLCAANTGNVQLDIDISGALSYLWTGPGINSSNETLKSPVINYTDLMTGANNFTCSVTLDAPCSSTTVSSLIINVNPQPTITITNPVQTCSPNTIDITAPLITAGSDPDLTYTYFSDDAATIPVADPAAVTLGDTYYIKGTNTNGCTAIVPVIVTINDLPLAVISYLNAPYCQTGTAVADELGTAGGTYSSDANLSINPSTGEIDLEASTIGDHIITYLFSDGSCSNTFETTIKINPLPVASISYPNASYCNRGSATVVQTGIAGGDYTSDPGLVINETTGEIDLASSTPGTYIVNYDFNDGTCSNTTTTNVAIIGEVTLAGPAATACASDGSGYVLTLNVSGETPFTVTGTGAPGTWSGSTWTSDPITAGTDYNVDIQDSNACNTLTVAAVAPICCLFEVTCPTFPATTITCYDQLPTAVSLTKAEFEALGNGDGTIGDIPCGVIEITASNGANPGCNGNITRTYTVTEYADPNNNGVRDAGENTILNTSICTQTFTIDRADFTMPPNDGKTVACPADVVAPTVPVVTDNCGNILTPSTPIVPPFPACNGDVPYTYTFTDCEGNTHNWVYTYTINRADFTMPANQGSTVACAASIVAPNVPVVTDNCGNTLTPSSPVISTTPACNGDVTYTYTFTDCNGNIHDWVYTYTIERLDFTMPANQGSTVACAASIAFPVLPVITDNCGNILTPSVPAISPTPCNGDVTFTYTYTDCIGNRHDWVYTYTIERLDFTMPANQGSTVSCPSSIVAPTVPVVTDNCGNTLTPSAPVISTTPACNGDVTYKYTFTDCAGNTHDWIYTYTIERTDFTMPANQGSTVACATSMAFPILPVVTDNCGNILTPSVPTVSPTPICNGDVTYTYTYTDCAGNKHDWVYTYTIERLDFTMPANQGSTVSCPSSIVAPTVPVVTDNCGNTLTPSAPVISTTPACNGDVTYKYTFTDCAGNTHDWIYTYTIERTDFTMPANQGSTVACATSMAFPILPVVTDNCGNILTPSVPTVSPTPICNGDVTYTYTYTDCAGNKHDWVYTYTIERLDFTMPANQGSTVACAASIVTPTVPVVTDNCGNTLAPSAPAISPTPACNGDLTYTYTFTDCAGNTHDWIYTYTIERTDFVMPANGASTVACASSIATPTVPTVTDNCGNTLTPSAPAISTTPTCNGDVTYTYTFTDCAGNKHDWVYTYTIATLDFTMPANGASTVACASSIVAPIVPVVTDNCGNTLTPSAPAISTTSACNGDVTYKYTFTDCAGNTHDWVYTYTIETLDFTMPANSGSTVVCASSIVAPTIPVVTDNCGNTLTPSAPAISATPACNGDVTYTYTFTDCTGNAHNWVYTYTIETTDFVMPANGASTVACASSIVTPTIPVVTDNCGNTLTPSAPAISTTPACNGDVTYKYTFTDCGGNTHDWVYTYTIATLDFTMPANSGSTVACASSIVAPTVPVVTDNCGNTLTPSAPAISATPACNGDVTYTYTFTDCGGNTHDWIYTYTINNTVAPTGTVPANLSLQCIEDVPIANINGVTNATSNCNGTTTITVVDTNNGGSGCAISPYVVTRTYTLTDCGGLTTSLIQTITVIDTTAPVFAEALPANITVDCSAVIPTAVTLTATDNCSTATVTYNEVRINGNCSGNYQLQRTWTANDACGNQTTHTQVITVADTTAPVFVEPLPAATVEADCSTIPPAATLTATDNCGTATVDYNETKVDGSCSTKYNLIRTWTASDNCGNQNTYTQTINVSCLAEIYNAISPNGDGMNDTFKIEGIDCFPNNTVEIFNRYGVIVYKKDGYDNVTNPFAGISDGRATLKQGDKLPTGTYFYTLRYDDNGKRVEKAGYLYINNQ